MQFLIRYRVSFLTKTCDTLFILLLSYPIRGWSSICRIGNVLNALFPSFLPEYIFPLSHPCLHYLHSITVMDRSLSHLPPTCTTSTFRCLTSPAQVSVLPVYPVYLVCPHWFASSESLAFQLMLTRLSSLLPRLSQTDCLSILLACITLTLVPQN